ncbi:hypothetical protein QL989_03325 [Pseudoalteromonas sp. APC 3224]|uniref:hypothetical protein n=1 Tax=Pseudoalteromonas sp. APC 3224 TaxID=3035203 RepID=UPI0025B4A602|nr:hypothetical protein [Pseudoalteromonas sp. APC 3224]MDN3484373.1 hypothetical protein [Pseudoalteromonas sp. APC 3224]
MGNDTELCWRVCLTWCHIFGNRADDLHFSSFFNEEAVKECGHEFSFENVKSRLLSLINMDNEQYLEFWQEVKACRHQCVAHKVVGASVKFPHTDLCRIQAEELRSIISEYVTQAVVNNLGPEWNKWQKYYQNQNNMNEALKENCSRLVEASCMKTDLLKLTNEISTPFDNSVLVRFDDEYKNLFFLDKEDELQNEVIPLEKIVGHDQGYGELTWKQNLLNLKRIKSRLNQLIENPHYYLNNIAGDKPSYIKVNDKFFISCGKHRSTIARYFAYFNPELFPSGPQISGAKVTVKYLDEEFNNSVRELKSLLSEDRLDFPACTRQFLTQKNTLPQT